MNSDTIVVFRPERTHLLAAGVMLAIMLLVIGARPALLFWLPIIPLVFILWVLRSSTTVSESGIEARYLAAATKAARWEEIQGVSFKGSKTILHTNDGRSFPLPAVSFNSLPQLETASRGRIPDALTQGKMAADEKIVIVHRDGYQEMLTKEQYEQRQAENK
ncbi:PH domain-containing protein [Corynebacterium diphtheriae]|nr:PH domain-containing protein [Corynebacterium diphtheriae]